MFEEYLEYSDKIKQLLNDFEKAQRIQWDIKVGGTDQVCKRAYGASPSFNDCDYELVFLK